MTIRVLLVDDQSMVRAGLLMLLAKEPDIEVVAEAENGLEAVAKAARVNPEVVLMDIRMPVLNGVEATRRILEADELARVLILTTFDPDEYVYEAIRAGASGFLLKDVEPEELVDAIRVVAAGNALLGATVTQRLLERFAGSSPAQSPSLDVLTEREIDILRLVAQGMSNAEIADRLVVGETTVKSHVSSILRKLRVRDRVQAVIAAYDAGLVRPAPR